MFAVKREGGCRMHSAQRMLMPGVLKRIEMTQDGNACEYDIYVYRNAEKTRGGMGPCGVLF